MLEYVCQPLFYQLERCETERDDAAEAFSRKLAALSKPAGDVLAADLTLTGGPLFTTGAVAWALCSPRFAEPLAVDMVRKFADERMARYADVDGRYLRPLIYGEVFEVCHENGSVGLFATRELAEKVVSSASIACGLSISPRTVITGDKP